MEIGIAIIYCISAFIKYLTVREKKELLERELKLCQQSGKTKKPKQ
jgi:hypothetical protein